MTDDSGKFIHWFRSASPYIRVHRGKTFVIQIDDDAVHSDGFTDLVHDLALLNSLGIRLVLVYSTRHSIEVRLQDHQIESRYHHGMRVTDAEAMQYVTDAAGKLRIEIEACLSMGLGNTPMSNADVRVVSGNFITARPLGIIDGVDYQFTGEFRSADVDSIKAKLDGHEIVLIPPLGYSVTGETFNLGAGALASKLAVALEADKLIYLMESGGLKDEEGQPVSQMTQMEAEVFMKNLEDDAAKYYLGHAINACAGGVGRVHLIERSVEGAVLQELFTRDGAGTMISRASYDVIRKATVDDIAGILDVIAPLEKAGVLVPRSREKLELEIEHFTVMSRDEVIIGCAALYPFPSETSGELACLAVQPEYHNNGRGEELLAAIESEGVKYGLRQLFVLTTQTRHWFRENGFEESSIEDLPVEKKQLYNYQRKSRVLVKNIG